MEAERVAWLSEGVSEDARAGLAREDGAGRVGHEPGQSTACPGRHGEGESLRCVFHAHWDLAYHAFP